MGWEGQPPPGYRKVPNKSRALWVQRRRLTMSDATTEETKVTVGLDLGDRHTQVCVLDEAGEVIEEARLATKPEALRCRFSGADPLRIVLEAGAHSPLSEPPPRGARARGDRGRPPQAPPDLLERLEVRPGRRRVPRPGGPPRPGAACSPAAPRRRDPGRSRPPAQPPASPPRPGPGSPTSCGPPWPPCSPSSPGSARRSAPWSSTHERRS